MLFNRTKEELDILAWEVAAGFEWSKSPQG